MIEDINVARALAQSVPFLNTAIGRGDVRYMHLYVSLCRVAGMSSSERSTHLLSSYTLEVFGE